MKPDPNMVLSIGLLDRKGEVPARSGLNWGQRPGRNPAQAYIAIPRNVGLSGFFPDPGVTFHVTTDCGQGFDLVRAQANGKALQSPADNALLGRFFRARLGLASDARITTHDLFVYGRTDVTFTRRDQFHYLMDFGAWL